MIPYEVNDDVVHVYPTNDLFFHDFDDDNCECGPSVEAIKRDDGSYAYMITHNSLDGRELFESHIP